ncbi:MAG: hypothetical protein AAFO75_12290 [Pseudomonadota bacterium]
MTNTTRRAVSGNGLIMGWLGAALIVATALFSHPVQAKKVSDRVKVACSSDYSRFCQGYKVGGSKLRSCMRSNGKRLSRVCIEALVDAGEVPRRVLRNRR